jgi:hypothetical protein
MCRSRFELPLGLVPPVRLGDSLVRAGVASDGGHDLEVIDFNCPLHHLHGLEVSKHISKSHLARGGGATEPEEKGAYPTEQMLVLLSIVLATSNASLSSSNRPVAIGFSTNKATPGSFFKSWSSISLPGRVLPRNIGGLPITTALGYSALVIVLMNSSKFLHILVFA